MAGVVGSNPTRPIPKLNQTAFTLDEIQKICSGRNLIDVPSLNCTHINQCLSFGLSIEECYNKSKTGNFDVG